MTTIKVDKVIPKTGTSIQLGDSGDTFTVPAGATIENLGTATGFGTQSIVGVKTVQYLESKSISGSSWQEFTNMRLTYTAASTSNRLLFLAQLCYANSSSTSIIFKFRDNTTGTDVAVANAAGSRPQATARGHNNSTSWGNTSYMQGWVTPTNTSAHEYSIYLFNHNGSTATMRVNSNSNNSDSSTADNSRGISQFTIIEFASGVL